MIIYNMYNAAHAYNAANAQAQGRDGGLLKAKKSCSLVEGNQDNIDYLNTHTKRRNLLWTDLAIFSTCQYFNIRIYCYLHK